MKRLFAAVLLALFVASSAHPTTTIAPEPKDVRLAPVGEVVEILRAHLAENPEDYAAWASLGSVHANAYARGIDAVELRKPRKEGEAPEPYVMMPPRTLAKRLESVSEPRAAHLAQAVRCFQNAIKGESGVKDAALVGLGYALWECRDRFAQIPWPLEAEAFDAEAQKHAAESEWWSEQALSVLQQLKIPEDPASVIERDYTAMGTIAPACWMMQQILELRTTLSEEDKNKLESFRKISKGYRGSESAFPAELPPQPQELASLYQVTPAGMATAELYLRAGDAATDPSSIGSDLPYIGTSRAKEDFRGKPLSQEMVSQIATCLNAHKETFRLLDEAARGTESRYPVDLSKGVAVELPHLTSLRNLARLLALRSLHASVTGDSATVTASVSNCVALGDSLRKEPLNVSQLVRVAIIGIAIKALNEAQNRIELAPAEMLALQEKLVSLEGLDGLRAAFRVDLFRLLLEATNPLDATRLEGASPEVIAEMEKRRPKPDDIRKLFSELISSVDLPAVDAMDECERANEAAHSIKMTALCRVIHDFHIMHAQLRGAQIALAVDRYSRTNAGPPETLEELVPVYLRTIPLDPFDEQPMRYRLEEGGFLVYSVGDNLVDDNGVQDVPTNQETKRYADIPYRVGVAAVSSEAEEGEPRW